MLRRALHEVSADAVLHASCSPIVGNLLASGSCLNGSSLPLDVHVFMSLVQFSVPSSCLESAWRCAQKIAISHSVSGMSTFTASHIIRSNKATREKGLE